MSIASDKDSRDGLEGQQKGQERVQFLVAEIRSRLELSEPRAPVGLP